MAAYLCKSVPVILGKAQQTVTYVEFMLADHAQSAVAKQFIIVQKTTCYGVLYSHKGYYRGVVAYTVEHLLKSVAAHYVQLF